MFDRQKNDSAEKPQSSDYAISPESSSPSTRSSASNRHALIGSTINIKGDISGDENLIIEGKVEGNVDLSSKEVIIGQGGRVHANVIANVIKIEGEVQGDMSGKEKVIISKTGNVKGNIIAPRVTLEDGAKFKGSIDMDPAIATPVTPIKPKANTLTETKGQADSK